MGKVSNMKKKFRVVKTFRQIEEFEAWEIKGKNNLVRICNSSHFSHSVNHVLKWSWDRRSEDALFSLFSVANGFS